jgi:biotin carboxyl carrier protein
MADYFVSIGEREFQVKIERGRLTVDGERLDVSLTPLNGSGMQLLRRDQQAVEMYFSPQDAMNYQVLVEGHLIQAQVRSQAGKPKSASKQAEGALTAPMPGLVVEVNVSEGETVEKGHILAVVESMKMQMQMRAAVTGRVSKVAVKSGEQVQKGQLLVLVVPAEAEKA